MLEDSGDPDCLGFVNIVRVEFPVEEDVPFCPWNEHTSETHDVIILYSGTKPWAAKVSDVQ
jgi:hypothetical protein